MKQRYREPQGRGIRKTFRFNRAEAQDLEKKAKKACLSQSDLIRMLLKGYVPPEKPGEEFYDKLSEMRSMADRLETNVPAGERSGDIEAVRGRSQALASFPGGSGERVHPPEEK